MIDVFIPGSDTLGRYRLDQLRIPEAWSVFTYDGRTYRQTSTGLQVLREVDGAWTSTRYAWRVRVAEIAGGSKNV